MAHLDENGHEVVSDQPRSAPVRIRARSYYDSMRDFIRQEVSRQAQQQGHESFEEADDFDVGDDYEPSSKYELDDFQLNAPLTSGSPQGADTAPEDAPQPAPEGAAPQPDPGANQ